MYTSNEYSYFWGPLRECLWARQLRPTLLLHTTCVRFGCTRRTSCVAASNKNKKQKSSLLNLKGGPEPSILNDLCLGNVISKYFSKLRFGTNQIQPELKCLENILLSFYGSLLRARLCEHELFSVRSIAFISTVVKSPDETWNKYEAICMWTSRGYYTSGLVNTKNRLRLNSFDRV